MTQVIRSWVLRQSHHAMTISAMYRVWFQKLLCVWEGGGAWARVIEWLRSGSEFSVKEYIRILRTYRQCKIINSNFITSCHRQDVWLKIAAGEYRMFAKSFERGLLFHRDCDNTVLLSESFEIFTEVFLHIPVSNHCNLFCKYERESL